MSYSPEEQDWSEPVEVSPMMLETIENAIEYLADNEEVYISTCLEILTVVGPVADRVGGVAATDVLNVQFWADTPGAMERFYHLLKGIGISSLN